LERNQWRGCSFCTSRTIVTNLLTDPETPSVATHFARYVYNNPKREHEIRSLYKISSTIMGLWLLEQVEKGSLQEDNRRLLGHVTSLRVLSDRLAHGAERTAAIRGE
jgi:hypothetical protein